MSAIRLTPPKATQKRYWASLTRTVEVRAVEEGGVSLVEEDDATPVEGGVSPVEICGQTEVFQHLRDDIALRRQVDGRQVHGLLSLTHGPSLAVGIAAPGHEFRLKVRKKLPRLKHMVLMNALANSSLPNPSMTQLVAVATFVEEHITR